MKILSTIKVTASVNICDVIVENILDTGVDVVSAKNINSIYKSYNKEEIRKIL